MRTAPCKARAVAGQLAAATREEIDRRVQFRPGKLGVELRLLDARGRHAQVGVVRDGLSDRRGQLIVVERRRASCRRRRRRAPAAVHCAGVCTKGSACSLRAAASGGFFSTQPAHHRHHAGRDRSATD